MLFSVLLSLCLCLVSANLTDSLVFAPIPAREVGQTVELTWSVSSAASNASILLQLTSDRPDVLLEPLPITPTSIGLKQKSFTWTIPRFLKTSDSYQIAAVSADGKDSIAGTSKRFTLINPFPLAQSTLTLLEPSGAADGSQLEATCLLNEACLVRWDFPAWATSAVPKTLNLALYSAEDGRKVLDIAQGVSSAQKSLTWQVPGWSSLEMPAAYVVISGPEVKKVPGPGVACYNAAGGYPFILESRSSRDARAAKEHRSVDYMAPGPIMTGSYDNSTLTQTFLDVPRPTYAPLVGDAVKDEASSSSAVAVKPSLMGLMAVMATIFGLIM